MSGPTKNVTHHGTNTLPAVNQRCVIQVPRCMPLTGPSVRMASLRMACCVSAIGCVLCTPRLCESSPRADTLPGHISTGIDLGKPCLNHAGRDFCRGCAHIISFILVAGPRVLSAPTTVPCGHLKRATDWHACRNLSLAPALRPNQGSGHVDVAHERPREQPTISFFYNPSIRLLEECRFRAPRCVLQSWMR
jgi:hypothetical protein